MKVTPALETGSLVGGRYTIESVLGTGATATVYAVRDASGERRALKVLGLDKVPAFHHEEARARLLREATTAAGLDHPHVVRVLDAGTDEATGTPYLVMPLVAGGDLATVLERTGALEPQVAARIVLQAAQGLAVAHAAGIVHRDVKPSNLLFAPEPDGTMRVQVADFGLAKAYREVDALTASGAFLGTPSYVSPEQALSAKHADPRADVWSLGMVLYHALTGRPAYTHAAAFLRFFVGTDPHVPAVQEHAPWVDGRLARVVHGALLRAADARLPSIEELSWALLLTIGYDASQAPLGPGDLAPASHATRSRVAERVALPSHWSELQRY